MTDPRVQQVVDAWTVEGPQPGYHRKAQAFLRNQWPALADALDALTLSTLQAQARRLDPDTRPELNCPEYIQDDRHASIRCWLPAGHEGNHR